MTEHREDDGSPAADDMSQYLQLFLDETEEQLDDLVESLLILENAPDSQGDLNEAFRLIHSIKGAAGMMGLESITALTHHLENRFEQCRSGLQRLDQSTMNLVLRCIDFLRDCNRRLRHDEQLGSSADLLEELHRLENQHETVAPAAAGEVKEPEGSSVGDADTETTADAKAPLPPAETPAAGEELRVTINFEPDLALADLKARLIVSRLSALGNIKSTRPTQQQLETVTELSHFELMMETDCGVSELRAAANVDGVQSIEFDGVLPDAALEDAAVRPGTDEDTNAAVHTTVSAAPEPRSAEETGQAPAATETIEDGDPSSAAPETEHPADDRREPAVPDTVAKSKVAETMRVAIDRLDNLMNLAGQLVINRARFVQLADQLNPALRRTNEVHRVREFGDSVKRTIEALQSLHGGGGTWTTQIRDLETGLEFLAQQLQLWDDSRHCVNQVHEAVDQLSRISDSLQRGVMGTRMVPVGPLFSRFKRVLRDLAMDRGKQVRLRVRGEQTELDKRMIDQLGDPLMHLVRNCVDHGLEQPELRAERGKPETGTISLEASHSGNNIYVQVRDDGGGINVERIKHRLAEQGILTKAALDELTDAQVADFIWHPGLSTATEVTDVSGRGVGMDVVKTRIAELNGSVEVQAVPEQGTTFTIRLPLTLAIINSLLVRMHDVIFSIPLEDVREIVSVHPRDIVTIRGKQTFDVRGEFIPLVQIEDVFDWHETARQVSASDLEKTTPVDDGPVDVVILHAQHRTLGVRVVELLGSQDIVIKSLAENFVHIRGLSGASILGDGTVCLMLDVGAMLDMV